MASSGFSSNSEEALIEEINNGLQKAIHDDGDIEDANTVLHSLIYGRTTPVLAAAEILGFIRVNKDPKSYLESFSTQVISLACNYPFLQPQLVSLVVSIVQLPPASLPDEKRSYLEDSFTTSMGDVRSSNYGHLFDDSRRSQALIHDHIHLSRFEALLLSALGENENPKYRLTVLSDALFILSTSLEDHSDSHHLPDIDVPAAAQYMIHAGDLFFDECNKGTGQNRASESPLWATRGKLWTKQPGLSRERWDFWSSRFKEISRSDNVADATAKDADTAVRAMIEVEKNAGSRT